MTIGGSISMEHFGRIISEPDPPGIDNQRWVELIGQHPNLVLFQPGYGMNPFTKEPLAILPKPDTADLVVGGEKLGFMEWSQHGENEIWVSLTTLAVIPLLKDLAESLGGHFEELGTK